MQQNIDWVVLELALESRLSRANGNGFQNLFSDMIEPVYGNQPNDSARAVMAAHMSKIIVQVAFPYWTAAPTLCISSDQVF